MPDEPHSDSDSDYPPMTPQQVARIDTLEDRGTTGRSASENEELQDLYLHRWLWRNIKRKLKLDRVADLLTRKSKTTGTGT